MTSLLKFGTTALVALSVSPAFAASPSILTAVLGAPEVSSMTNIDKIAVVDTFRCPGCYNIEIVGSNKIGPAYMKVHTAFTPGKGLTITALEQSK